jgi:glycosyltransferase involved in cell wall biosynthesis
MKTAVLMATYNGADFIKEQLDSIRMQTEPPTYVIMRDDCSTDNTVETVEEYISKYQLKGWSIVRNGKNSGWRSNFRQLLLDCLLLDVETIFFSDQDDVWKLDKNEQQLTIFNKNSEIEVLSGDLEFIKLDEEATVPTLYEFPDKDQVISKYPAHKNYQGGFRQGMTLAIRKTLITDIMKYWKPEFKPTHDMVFQNIASLLGVGYNLNQIVASQKRHGNNASGRPAVSIRDSKEVHLQDLFEKSVGYHYIAYNVLKDRNSQYAEEQRRYLDWSKRRYEASKNRRLFETLKIVTRDKKYYTHFTGRIRDLYFLFKR